MLAECELFILTVAGSAIFNSAHQLLHHGDVPGLGPLCTGGGPPGLCSLGLWSLCGLCVVVWDSGFTSTLGWNSQQHALVRRERPSRFSDGGVMTSLQAHKEQHVWLSSWRSSLQEAFVLCCLYLNSGKQLQLLYFVQIHLLSGICQNETSTIFKQDKSKICFPRKTIFKNWKPNISKFCREVLEHWSNFSNLAGRLILWVEPANLPVLWEGLWRRVVGFLRLGQPRWVGGSYWWLMPRRTAVGWQQWRYLSHNKLL